MVSADLYSLGIMFYELTAGRLPFLADDPIAVISQHLYAPVVPPSTYNTEISAVLDALILRLMSKRPTDRPGSAGEVILELDALMMAAPQAAPQPLHIGGAPVLERIPQRPPGWPPERAKPVV